MWKRRQPNSSSGWAHCLFSFFAAIIVLCTMHMHHDSDWCVSTSNMDVYVVTMRVFGNHNTQTSDKVVYIIRFCRIYFSAEFKVGRHWSACPQSSHHVKLWVIVLDKATEVITTLRRQSHIVKFCRICFSAEFIVARHCSTISPSCQTLSNSPWQGHWGKSACNKDKIMSLVHKYKLNTKLSRNEIRICPV